MLCRNFTECPNISTGTEISFAGAGPHYFGEDGAATQSGVSSGFNADVHDFSLNFQLRYRYGTE
jgi:hypothetical protein